MFKFIRFNSATLVYRILYTCCTSSRHEQWGRTRGKGDRDERLGVQKVDVCCVELSGRIGSSRQDVEAVIWYVSLPPLSETPWSSTVDKSVWQEASYWFIICQVTFDFEAIFLVCFHLLSSVSEEWIHFCETSECSAELLPQWPLMTVANC